MLAKPSIDELEKRIEDRFLICTLASKRARDLYDKRPITEEVCERKVAQAAKEIDMGLITYKEGVCDTTSE